MPVTAIHNDSIQGIDERDVLRLRNKFGKNIFSIDGSPRIVHILWDIIRDPMFILLVVACGLYFILGRRDEGAIMALAILFVSGISVYEEVRSTKALAALKQFTDPRIPVIRSGKEKVIPTDELVPGDIILLSEGNKIPADAVVIQQNDLSVNESVITGESLPVEKNEINGKSVLYQGTTINSGRCYARVTAIGNNTVLGKLGKAIGTIALQKPYCKCR